MYDVQLRGTSIPLIWSFLWLFLRFKQNTTKNIAFYFKDFSSKFTLQNAPNRTILVPNFQIFVSDSPLISTAIKNTHEPPLAMYGLITSDFLLIGRCFINSQISCHHHKVTKQSHFQCVYNLLTSHPDILKKGISHPMESHYIQTTSSPLVKQLVITLSCRSIVFPFSMFLTMEIADGMGLQTNSHSGGYWNRSFRNCAYTHPILL